MIKRNGLIDVAILFVAKNNQKTKTQCKLSRVKQSINRKVHASYINK